MIRHHVLYKFCLPQILLKLPYVDNSDIITNIVLLIYDFIIFLFINIEVDKICL